MAEYNPSKIIKDGNTYNFRDTTKIPLAGSNAISGSLIPSTDGTVNLGSSSYQWNNAYIKNYYYNGVQWGLDRANVWTGTQSFTSAFTRQEGTSNTHGYVIKAGFARGSAPSTVTNLTFRWLDLNDSILGFLDFVATSSTYAARLNLRTENNGTQVVESIQLETDLTGSYFSFKPLSNGNVGLGTSTNKWKSFNGINPGALSLPSTYVNVDTTNWVLDGSQPNLFVPTSDGWLGIQVTDTVYDQMHYVFIGRTDGGNTYYQQNVLSPINALWNGEYHGCVFIPVIKNVRYDIRCICSTIVTTFYPCQGNV